MRKDCKRSLTWIQDGFLALVISHALDIRQTDDGGFFGSAIPPTPAGAENFLNPFVLKPGGAEKFVQT